MKDNKKNSARLILLNASPIGDHVLLLDLADRFYLSAGIPTTMFIKHNFAFLRDLSKGYPFIECVDFSSISGKLRFIGEFFQSMIRKTYLVYFLPIPLKRYLRLAGDAFHYLTRTDVISLVYPGMEHYVPKGIHIKADINDKFFYEQSNEILEKIGFKPVLESPHFRFIKDESVKKRYTLRDGYIVVHPTPSHDDRRISNDTWKEVFAEAQKEKRQIVFTGVKKDEEYIDSLAAFLPKDSFMKVIGAPAQDLVNIFFFAEKLFMVHTGPTHIAAGLHKKMKVFCHLWLKQFDMSYDKDADIEILSRVKDVISMNISQGGFTRDEYMRRARLFIYTGTGTIGDFITNTDLAEKFHSATNTPVVFFTIKKGGVFGFCEEMARSYDFISLIVLSEPKGLLQFIRFYFKSFFVKCFMHIIVDDNPTAKLRAFANFIAYCSRIRLSAFNYSTEIFSVNSIHKGVLMQKNYDIFHKDLLENCYHIDVSKLKAEANPIPLHEPNKGTEFKPKSYIILTVFASIAGKSRTPEQWAESIRTLIKYFPDSSLVFLGSKSVVPYYEKIRDLFDEDTRKDFFIDRIGAYQFDDLCSVITHAKLFVGLQSGLSHMAFRQHTPGIIFSVYGSVYFDIVRDDFINLINLKNCKCKEHNFHYCQSVEYFACAREVTNEEFEKAVLQIKTLKNFQS